MSTVLRQHFEKIISLTDDQFAYIMPHFVSRKFKKHQFIVQAGNPVEYDHFVVSGLLTASYINNGGKEHILNFAMEDWWVSDYQAYVNQARATLNIECVENTEVLCISFADKNKLCKEIHELEHFFRVKATSGYIALQRRILSLLNDDAQTRYAQLLGQYPSLSQRVPKALLAAYLGVSRETLSRLSK
jgi:CRP-like cAMP-binding protein